MNEFDGSWTPWEGASSFRPLAHIFLPLTRMRSFFLPSILSWSAGCDIRPSLLRPRPPRHLARGQQPAPQGRRRVELADGCRACGRRGQERLAAAQGPRAWRLGSWFDDLRGVGRRLSSFSVSLLYLHGLFAVCRSSKARIITKERANEETKNTNSAKQTARKERGGENRT